ncbi:MAG: tRNA preQ1(34) S-adenosylmethionine ribosyltransferase-isomerase QueA [Candidatus Omnitrophica bacterium]|nr:tRNA preQ1(34) S-adenosylmethionine ribosyltransferase-isomerase QueA [Candidatus Omnitrophota bacterium]
METDIFNLACYDYKIPPQLIAQEPVTPRDSSRLLVVNRQTGALEEHIFKDTLQFFSPGDVLVLNDTRVIKAKLTARRISGAQIDVLLVKQLKPGIWEVLANPAKRLKVHETVLFEGGSLIAKVLEATKEGKRVLEFHPADVLEHLKVVGRMPLPHYIKKEITDCEQYQTIYSKKEGAIAAPTAGLHFTNRLLARIEKKGVKVVYITLHCGLATFRPVTTEDIRQHVIESEWIEVSSAAAQAINAAKQHGKKVIAVGTTSIRSLETAAFCDQGETRVKAYSGPTNLYITPGYTFKIIDRAITNFHTPCSTNLILISAFCGSQLLQAAYARAIELNLRFFSFGDAMLIV